MIKKNDTLLNQYKPYIEKMLKNERTNYINKMLKLRIKEITHDTDGLIDIELLEAIALDNYIYEIAQTNLNNDFVQAYRQMIEPIINQYPHACEHFLIFQIGTLKKFSNETKSKIIEYNKNIQKILKKFNNNQTLSNDEESTLRNYLIGLMPTTDSQQNNLIKTYIEKKLKEICQYYYIENNQLKWKAQIRVSHDLLELITKYCIYDGLKIHGLPNDLTYVPCEMIHSNLTTPFGVACHKYNSISIINSYNNEKQHHIFTRILAAYHETRHINQRTKKTLMSGENKSMYYEAILRNIFYNEKVIDYYNKESEYNINYKNHEIEHDANRFGYFMVANWLKRINEPKLATFFDTKRSSKVIEQQVNTKKDNKNNKKPTWSFKFSMLNYLIKNDPSLLNQYPEFELLYHKDGKRKNIINVLAEINEDFIKIPEEKINFILDYFQYYCESIMPKNSIDIDTISEYKKYYSNLKKQDKINDNIAIIIRTCCWNIEYCNKSYDESDDPEMIIKRAESLINVIEKMTGFSSIYITKKYEYCEQYYQKALKQYNLLLQKANKVKRGRK